MVWRKKGLFLEKFRYWFRSFSSNVRHLILFEKRVRKLQRRQGIMFRRLNFVNEKEYCLVDH